MSSRVTSTSSSTLLAELAARLNTDRDVLRRKLVKLLELLNHGSTKVSKYGVSVDVLIEFESLLRRADDATVSKVLKVLRE